MTSREQSAYASHPLTAALRSTRATTFLLTLLAIFIMIHIWYSQSSLEDSAPATDGRIAIGDSLDLESLGDDDLLYSEVDPHGISAARAIQLHHRISMDALRAASKSAQQQVDHLVESQDERMRKYMEDNGDAIKSEIIRELTNMMHACTSDAKRKEYQDQIDKITSTSTNTATT